MSRSLALSQEQPQPQPQADALDKLPQSASNPMDLPSQIFTAALTRRKENRAALMGWIREAMAEGVDFGKIHSVGKSKCQLAAQGRAKECADPSHYSKPCLFKPGAEKICGMLGVNVHFPTLPDYEAAALAGTEIRTIILRCQLSDASGRIVAEGVGGRSLTQDYGDINKALKMAEKAAQIDATLRMAGLSEIFTQDLEDMRPLDGAPAPAAPLQPPSPPVAKVTRDQISRLGAMITNLGLDPERVKAWVKAKWGIDTAADLTFDQWRELVGPQFQNGRLHQWRAQLDKQPLTPEQVERVSGWLEGTGLTLDDVAEEFDLPSIRLIKQGQWNDLRETVQAMALEIRRSEWAELDPQERERRIREQEAAWHRSEESAGRSSTRGT